MQCKKYWICWKFSVDFTTDKNMNSNLITIDIITCGKGCMCVPLCCIVLSPSVVSNCLQLHGLWPTRLLCPWRFSRQEYWSGLPCPPPGDLLNLGIELRSSAVWVDSLLSEPPGKPMSTGLCSLSLLQGIFLTQELNWGLLNCRRILYQLNYQGSPVCTPS